MKFLKKIYFYVRVSFMVSCIFSIMKLYACVQIVETMYTLVYVRMCKRELHAFSLAKIETITF